MTLEEALKVVDKIKLETEFLKKSLKLAKQLYNLHEEYDQILSNDQRKLMIADMRIIEEKITVNQKAIEISEFLIKGIKND